MSNSTSSNSGYFPWDWTITSVDKQEHTCPTVSSLLGTFAAVNGVVSALAVVFGHRLVVKKLTCGVFGHRDSRSWVWMWIVPVGLQLAANAFIALLIKQSAGYKADFKISELMLFLVARPRLSWIILGGFAAKSQKVRRERERASRREEPQYPHSPNPSSAFLGTPQPYDNTYSPWASQHSFPNYTPYTSQTALNPYGHSAHAQAYHHVPSSDTDVSRGIGFHLGDRDFPWWSAFMTQFIGEYVLQIMSLYIMGRTAHFATLHGYYKIYHDSYWDIPSAARMMYSGALYYLVAGSLFLIFAAIFILYTIFGSRAKLFGKASNAGIVLTLVFLLISTWMGSWIFWAGFVKLAGDS